MDPISLIVAALVTGAAEGLASEAIKNSYVALKALLRRRFGKAAMPAASGDEPRDGNKGAGNPDDVLEAYEVDPAAWDQRLREVLKSTGAEQDQQILAAAQALLDRAGKYQVDARGAQGVQVGDHGTMTNTFSVTRIDPAQSAS